MTKLWERLRGYDKWIETTATFESAHVFEELPTLIAMETISYTYDSYDTIAWIDQKGETHRTDFRVPDDSPIYQLVDGNKTTIRYNPADPDRFYYPELLRTRIATLTKRIAIGVFFVAIILLLAWVRFS